MDKKKLLIIISTILLALLIVIVGFEIYNIVNNNKNKETTVVDTREESTLSDNEISNILSNIKVFYNYGSDWFCDYFCSVTFETPTEVLNDKNINLLKGVFATSIEGIGEDGNHDEYGPSMHIYSIEEIQLFIENLLHTNFTKEEIYNYFLDYYDRTTDRYYFVEGGAVINKVIKAYKENTNEIIIEFYQTKMKIKKENDQYYVYSNIQNDN